MLGELAFTPHAQWSYVQEVEQRVQMCCIKSLVGIV